MACLEHRRPGVRASAMEALGQVAARGDVHAVNAIQWHLVRCAAMPDMRDAAIGAFAEVADVATATAVLDHEDAIVRSAGQAAVTSLAALGDEGAAKALLHIQQQEAESCDVHVFVGQANVPVTEELPPKKLEFLG
eukprot:TRINITY_DN69558_c0_g1_i1.p2 TRINITY_DN69558_c0_g1~~TRINITY_DN69558_c0_g1_i1.p2  ORF type:complete len:136 (+),score=28.82 TRINITY_DN69558_c0_g1_i1:588-995(+)